MKYILFYFLFFISIKASFGRDNADKANKFLQESKYDSANYYYDLAINDCKGLCHDTTLAQIYVHKGKSLKLKEEFKLALIDYTQALNLYKRSNHINGIVYTLVNLTEFYRSLHKFEKALLYIEEAEKLIDSPIVTTKNKAYFYNRYAATLTEATKDRKLPIQYSKKAIKFAKQSGDKNIEASSLNELGFIYKEQDYIIAFEYYFKALNIYEEINNKRHAVSIIANIARGYHDICDYKNCIKYCDKGLKLVRPTDWNMVKRDLYYYKYRSHNHMQEYKSAMLASNECRIYAEAVIINENKKALYELQIQYDVNEKNNQILLEQQKANSFKKETEDKKREINLILLIVVLLLIILLISIIAYLKIKKSNQLLNKTIDQKDILLQEVHHRVKNNLTLLSSLLYLRAKISDNEDVVNVLKECQSRVQAMALVHQNLYDVDDTSKVDFKKFISQLIVESESLFSKDNEKVSLEIETNNIYFEMGFSVFLGLIINELITNSLKHAFKCKEVSIITISLSNTNNSYSLAYSDSGEGLPKSFDLENSTGFGFKLVKLMVNQIDGHLEYNHSRNIFKLQFKL